MIARHRIRRKSLRWRSRGGLSKLGGWFLDITVGYGHRLWQAGVWLVALVAIGGLLFGEIYRVDHGGTGSVRGFDLYPSRDVKEVPPFLLTICGWLLTTALIAGLAARRM